LSEGGGVPAASGKEEVKVAHVACPLIGDLEHIEAKIKRGKKDTAQMSWSVLLTLKGSSVSVFMKHDFLN
jgi:hypothetical protein